MLKGKKILIISPENWNRLHVSKHHYAEELSRNSHVYFLNPPTDKKSTFPISKSLHILDCRPMIIGLRYFPQWITRYLVRHYINSLESFLEIRFDIIWTFDPSRIFDLTLLKDKLRICHIVDENQGFQLKKLAKSVDLCIAISESIRKKLKKYNSHVIKVSHGFKAFSSKNEYQMTFTGDKNVIYAGNLDIPYIDWKLIDLLTEKHQDWTFNFFGSYSEENKDLNELKIRSNVKIFGPVKPDVLQCLLHCASILLIFYDSEKFEAQVANPHKFMEYLGSGKVIVSSYAKEYSYLKEPLVLMGSNRKETVNLFQKAIDNLDCYNAESTMNSRKLIAQDNSYEKKVKQIEDMIIRTFY